MDTASELWVEAKFKNHHEILGSLIRVALNKENVQRLDLDYLGNRIDQWWLEGANSDISPLTHSTLKLIVLETLKPEHLECIRSIGSVKTNVAAVLMEHTFRVVDKNLALLVHEVMAEIAGIVDIKYPYEDHKELFPKDSGKEISDWGKGLGIIRPHSDDIYEKREINAMCLTVCKDTSCTPTWFWPLKDIIACLTDEELGVFSLAEASFLSGANVEGKVIESRKPILRLDGEEGISLRIDFRIDDAVGPRMRLSRKRTSQIFGKMRAALKNIKPVCTNPSTGSIGILSNFKILHGRSALDPLMLQEGEASRILFRSKGFK